jgi:hypothetical protein
MSKPVPASFRTTNRRAYDAALRHGGSLLICLGPEMEWMAAPSDKRGWPAIVSDAGVQACLRRDGRCLA